MVIRSIPVASSSMRQADTDSESWAMSTFITTPSSMPVTVLAADTFLNSTGKSLGWYDNLELTGKMHSVGWSHLIFDDRYSDIVDIYEEATCTTEAYSARSQNSCMNNDIPYYSTISRESIVKRIKAYAGETYSFEDFVKNDKRDAGIVESRTFGGNGDQRTV